MMLLEFVKGIYKSVLKKIDTLWAHEYVVREER